jgi:ferredoxin
LKTSIYYFSGTGNSLAVSRDLAAELQGDVSLIPMAKHINNDLLEVESDIAGIVFPVYCHDLPKIVEEFAKKIVVKSPYVFAISTFNKSPGNALFNLNSILIDRNSKVHSGFEICMPGNSVLVIDLTTTDAENETRINGEKNKVKKIASIINQKKEIGIEGIFNDKEKYEAKIFLEDVYKVCKKFWTTEACSSCGICAKVCPRGNITLVDDEVIWGDKCEHCLACLHWCPEKAIQNGDNSEKCRRYQHNEVTWQDIAAQK